MLTCVRLHYRCHCCAFAIETPYHIARRWPAYLTPCLPTHVPPPTKHALISATVHHLQREVDSRASSDYGSFLGSLQDMTPHTSARLGSHWNRTADGSHGQLTSKVSLYHPSGFILQFWSMSRLLFLSTSQWTKARTPKTLHDSATCELFSQCQSLRAETQV